MTWIKYLASTSCQLLAYLVFALLAVGFIAACVLWFYLFFYAVAQLL